MEQIKNRFTGKIMCGGLSLKIVLEKHQKWLRNEDGGKRADLSDANLSDANLRRADLRRADLRRADLSDAPSCLKIENIHQKVYQAASKENALDMGTWHQTDACGTTHCRAGWVINLAGDTGRVLEYTYGTPAAAAIIYMLSDPELKKIPNFYCDNETALGDMKRLAEFEAAK